MKVTHGSGTALVLGALICGCTPKPTTISKSSPEVRSNAPLIVAPPKAVPASKPDPPEKLTVFLPDGKGKLRRTMMEAPTDFAEQQLWKPESALTMLFRRAPEIIPPGTKLIGSIRKNMDYKDSEGSSDTVFEVRLNKKFLKSDLWRNSKKAQMAFDAITQTATMGIVETVSPTYPTRILVLVDEKPIRKLGNYKVENPTEGY